MGLCRCLFGYCVVVGLSDFFHGLSGLFLSNLNRKARRRAHSFERLNFFPTIPLTSPISSPATFLCQNAPVNSLLTNPTRSSKRTRVVRLLDLSGCLRRLGWFWHCKREAIFSPRTDLSPAWPRENSMSLPICPTWWSYHRQ